MIRLLPVSLSQISPSRARKEIGADYFSRRSFFAHATDYARKEVGADPGVFLGVGAPVRNGITDFFFFFFFFAEYQLH